MTDRDFLLKRQSHPLGDFHIISHIRHLNFSSNTQAITNLFIISILFQEAAKESKAALLSPEDQEDVESPLPSNIVQPVRRRGAISAEPINEEDAATYVKKVSISLWSFQTFINN